MKTRAPQPHQVRVDNGANVETHHDKDDLRRGASDEVRRQAARVLRRARRRKGWSQLRLMRELERVAEARKAFLATRKSLLSMISRWENGRRTPGPHNRSLLCAALGIADAELGLPEDEEW